MNHSDNEMDNDETEIHNLFQCSVGHDQKTTAISRYTKFSKLKIASSVLCALSTRTLATYSVNAESFFQASAQTHGQKLNQKFFVSENNIFSGRRKHGDKVMLSAFVRCPFTPNVFPFHCSLAQGR